MPIIKDFMLGIGFLGFIAVAFAAIFGLGFLAVILLPILIPLMLAGLLVAVVIAIKLVSRVLQTLVWRGIDTHLH